MSCIFNVNNLDNSMELLGESLAERLSPIPDYGLTNVEDVKREILREIQQVSESFLINPENVDLALNVFEDDSLFWGMEDAIPSKEELKEAMIIWQKPESKEAENTSTDRLNNQSKDIQRVKDDPIGFAYGRALKAKIRAKLYANTVGVHSILYNQNGIINSLEDLHQAISVQLELLLLNVIEYLKEQGIEINGRMYLEGNYTGIVEEIDSKYSKYFKYDFNDLNNLYNTEKFKTLDAISSWVILSNFDTILKETFGEAISINPDKSKFNYTKYSIAGGSNVYKTWRTSEEIDLAKEINNISLAIITSIPYYLADSLTPSVERNLKFNEFIYLIGKLKDIPHSLKSDIILDFTGLNISTEAKQNFNGKSLIQIINTLRDNPQKYLPMIIEIFNNKTMFDLISENLPDKFFVTIDRDIINTVYLGLFNLNNTNSLYYIQSKSGFEGVNYYSFLTQTIDSTFKANFLQYFRNPEGEIYVRPMYDLSLYIIGENIKSHINNISTLIDLLNYLFEDDATHNYSEGSIYKEINGKLYIIKVNKYLNVDKQVTSVEYTTNKNEPVTDVETINLLQNYLNAKYDKISTISFIYDKFHKGPLKVEVNLVSGKITYSVNGIDIEFNSRKDYDSLLPIIEDVLKQNFDIDTDYFNAFKDIYKQNIISSYGLICKDLMNAVARVLTNKYIQEKYIKYLSYTDIQNRLNDFYGKDNTFKPTYNKKLNELNYLTNAETSLIENLAQAKALVTGRLTSSQIIDGDGNALASSTLSRLQNALDYLIEVQVKQSNSAAKNFTLWKPGVYKGIFLLKEMKDNFSSRSKTHTQFSAKEMENALVFVDFLQGLTTIGSTRSPYTDGIVGFYPSENSDKTYVGRILIDLQSIQIGETTLYDLLRLNPENIREFIPIVRLELHDFYIKALNNINDEWKKLEELGVYVQYGNWSQLSLLTEQYNAISFKQLTPVEYLKQIVTEYNYNHPFNPITLIENVHYVEDKNGNLISNPSFEANIKRTSSDIEFNNFIYSQELEVLNNILQDGVSVKATLNLINLLGEEWIDPQTNKVILAKYYDPITGETVANIRKLRDYTEKSPYIRLNPLISAYNILNYFITLEYMNSSVGAYYAHPNKNTPNLEELPPEQRLLAILTDEKVRKLAQDKRNVSFTAAMHAMLKNLIQGIPSVANIAIMPDVKDSFETISGDIESGIKPYDGATFTNPFFSILQNYSLGGAKVGNIKKTFTHYYDEKTGTGGIIKTAEFPLTNEYIRRSKFYLTMMQNMTDRIWRDLNGEPCSVDITTDYLGNSIVFNNPESDQGYMYFLDENTGDYYMFNISKKEDSTNTYIKTILKVDIYGNPTEDEPESTEVVVNTNYDLWQLFGGARSVSYNRGKFHPSEHSIKLVVEIMNKTTIEGTILSNVKTQEDVWQPLKHSDIHLMPTIGAVKQGAANVNELSSYSERNSSKINHFRIRMNQVGVQLDKEHNADGEDLSIMTLVLSACASRGYTPEMTLNLYNAMARLAEAGIRPYLDNFKQFFKISSNPNATAELLEDARLRFENVLLKTLINALANSTSTSATLQIVTQELLEKAKEGKDIDFANLKIPLSDPAVMRKLHSTISVALTRAAIKIKVDGSLNILCPSYGIVKVYNGKMYEDFLNDYEITKELEEWDKNPKSELIGNISNIKMGRTYKVVDTFGNINYINMTPSEYYKIKNILQNENETNHLILGVVDYNEGDTTFAGIPIIYGYIGEQDGRKIGARASIINGLKTILIDRDALSEKWQLKAWKNPLRSSNIEILDFNSELDMITWSLLHELGHHLYDTWKTSELRTQETQKTREDRANAFASLNFKYLHPEYKILSIKEQFASYTVEPKNTMLSPSEIKATIDSISDYNRKYQKAKELLGDFYYDPEDVSLEAYIAEHIGGLNFDSIKTELGWTKNDMNRMISILRTKEKGGVSIPTLAERIYADMPEGLRNLTDTIDVGNKIRDLLQSAQTPNDLSKYSLNQAIDIAILEYEHDYYTFEELRTLDSKTYEGGRDLGSYNVIFSGQILLRKINEKNIEQNVQIKSFNLYDLISVQNLHNLKQSKNYTKQELDQALAEVQKDLNTLHYKKGKILTTEGEVEIIPQSVEIEPYEIVLPKIFATVFGLTTEDNLNTIKNDPNFFTKRLIQNLSPKHNDYTICFQKTNGNHIYVLNSDNAVQSQYFRPKLILRIRENGKLYRQQNGELLYELNKNDLIWERINPDGTTTEVIITDSPLSYINRLDYITFNINKENSEEYNQNLIENLRNSKNNKVKKWLEAFDIVNKRPGESFKSVLEDVQEIDIRNYNDSPVGKYYIQLGNEIYASFLKSLEVVAARIPAQSMQSFMPMKVVGFEKSDINTAYVSTTLILFQGSDYDIDAVSIASYAFDNSGRYIIHSPLANISSYLLLKASENLPFPTGRILEINNEEKFDYSQLSDIFIVERGNQVRLDNSTPENIEKLGLFIEYCNLKGFIPSNLNSNLSLIVNSIRGLINRHNNYINTSKDVEKFSKNYMVTSMYNIGSSPANLIESQQGMDSIKDVLNKIASLTSKALQQNSLDNPADYTTNIRGFILNMDGKQGVGICAVGLKSFFAATARYNDVLNNGTPEEIERLKSDVTIAKKRFQFIANARTTNEVNKAILGEIYNLLDLGIDAALILSGLLSLATDNAKELALTKLNAANMLGMYIYGITIGMDFRDIANIIASETGSVIDSLVKEDIISGEQGMNMENIFDYLELGPSITNVNSVPSGIKDIYGTYLNQANLSNLAWGKAYINNEGKIIDLKEREKIPNDPTIITGPKLIGFYENLKRSATSINPYYNGIIEFNNNIEKALDYFEHIGEIILDEILVKMPDGSVDLIYYNRTSIISSVYGELKKLYKGGEELRRLGLLLHINLGNETSYSGALSYIDKLESSISSARYRKFREYKRISKNKKALDGSSKYEINFHRFVTEYAYREGCIDLYSGICRKNMYLAFESYRDVFDSVYIELDNSKEKSLETNFNTITKNIKSSKTFYNILDILNVPHYFQYLKSADMLHLYMQNSIKYRGIYNLGKKAIELIGAYSSKDREAIFRRTEQFIDRLLRDRFFISQNLSFEIPVGQDLFFKRLDGTIERGTASGISPIIKLGTREGNASFKLLMENVIIPELKKMDRFKNNKFILSLSTVLFSANPEQLTTRCVAPNINMSPRSDTDSAIFEEVKHDFNQLRTTDYKYLSNGIKYDLIDLFYYYNLIAFGGRIGENTLTNIFQDVLDFNNILNFRDFEAYLDKFGEIALVKDGGTITTETLIRETAPKANEYSTKLNYFYQENKTSGVLSFMERNKGENFKDPNAQEFTQSLTSKRKYIGSPVLFVSDLEAKDYLVQSSEADIREVKANLSNGLEVVLTFNKGSITSIKIDDINVAIPQKDLNFFRKLKTISRLENGILKKYYNKKLILSKIEEIINCK